MRAFWSDEGGATSVEYGLLLAILSLGVIVGYGYVKDGVNGLYNNVKTGLSSS
jgi:pilus assembly protein Flp/PilA